MFGSTDQIQYVIAQGLSTLPVKWFKPRIAFEGGNLLTGAA
jgi:hypothetical protein